MLPDLTLEPLTPAALLTTLDRWCDDGWLRRLDVALARWLAAELGEAVSPELLLAAAVLAQRESRGHTCIVLEDLLAQCRPESVVRPDDDAWLDGPHAAARVALAEVLLRLSPDRADWLRRLQTSGAVDALANAAQGHAPLVLDAADTAPGTSRLYLRRHWRDEQSVAVAVLARTGAGALEAAPDPATVRLWLDRLFGVRTTAAADPDWQRIACAMALRGRLALVTGGPGTGKTYTVARLLALRFALHPAPATLRIALAAPTGKAAARLKQSIDLALGALGGALPDALDWPLLGERLKEALTLHRLLGARPDTRALRHDAHHPLEVDLLVVDEASMVHLEMMAALLAALPARAQLVLLGDKDQLASVEAGAVLGDLCGTAERGQYDVDSQTWITACTGDTVPARFHATEHHPPALAQHTVMLRQSRRFDGAIGALALAVNAGDGRAADAVLRGADPAVQRLRLPEAARPALHGVLALALQGRPGAPIGYDGYLRALRNRPPAGDADAHQAWVVAVVRAFEQVRLLCALREGEWGVTGLNARIEAELRRRGDIARQGEWYAGRPVMITRNDAALGVYNGDVGVALPGVDGKGLRVWLLDGDHQTPRSVMASRLPQTETAFAMTVHKSQGSEFAHVALVLPPYATPVLTRELVYTGITRAKAAFTLVAPDPVVWGQALQRRTRRASGLPGLLQSGRGGDITPA
jgi:exodeoxyribonuclease V alpha subunit